MKTLRADRRTLSKHPLPVAFVEVADGRSDAVASLSLALNDVGQIVLIVTSNRRYRGKQVSTTVTLSPQISTTASLDTEPDHG